MTGSTTWPTILENAFHSSEYLGQGGDQVAESGKSSAKPSEGTADAQASAPALTGVRVLDLTQVLSGPFCTQMLADLGADVIKVESPVGDIARSMPPHFVGPDSAYYLAINRNKRSIVVDMKTPAGVDIVRRLALQCDIVIENFRPGVCERLGLSAAKLRAEKPSLIWCSISGFGQDGPYRNKPAYDIIVQAFSGGMSLTGEREGLSVRAGIPIADLSAGMYAATAVLAALHRRTRDRARRDHRHLHARLPGGDALLPGVLLPAFGAGAGAAGARARFDCDLPHASRPRTASSW